MDHREEGAVELILSVAPSGKDFLFESAVTH
jgi:hypothetical protein